MPLPLVLLVDGDPGVREPLRKFLELHHFRVVTADTAGGAMKPSTSTGLPPPLSICS